MSTKQILLGFLPWIAFSAISTRVGPGAAGAAALVAFVVAAALVARSYIRGESPKLLELTALVTFAGIGLWALLDPAAADVLAFYGRGGATLLLAVVIAVSLLGRPFTEQYARESVPQEYWDSPRFHAINRRISAAWAGTVAVMGVGHLLAGWLAAATGTVAGPADLVLNWLVPGLLIVLTVNYTHRVTAEADAPQAAR
jgi:hypothetical protein